MEERDDRPLVKDVQLVDKSFFDHLVSCDVHDPLVAPPQTEHCTIFLRQLHSELGLAEHLFSPCSSILFSALNCSLLLPLSPFPANVTSPSRSF